MQDIDFPTDVIPAYLLCHPWLQSQYGGSLELPPFDVFFSKLSWIDNCTAFLDGCAATASHREQGFL